MTDPTGRGSSPEIEAIRARLTEYREAKAAFHALWEPWARASYIGDVPDGYGAAQTRFDAAEEALNGTAPDDLAYLLSLLDQQAQDLVQSRAETEAADACTEKKQREMDIVWQRMLDEKRRAEAAEQWVQAQATEIATLKISLSEAESDGTAFLKRAESAEADWQAAEAAIQTARTENTRYRSALESLRSLMADDDIASVWAQCSGCGTEIGWPIESLPELPEQPTCMECIVLRALAVAAPPAGAPKETQG